MIDVACRLLNDGSRKCARYGPRPAVRHQVDAELAARVLDGLEHLTGRHPEALRDQLEVVDQGLHRGAHDLPDVVQRVAHAVRADRHLRRPGHLLVRDHDGTRAQLLQAVERLLHDPHRLVALLDPDHEAAPRIGSVGHGHVEVVRLVAAVRVGLAHVVRQARAAQHRTRDAERHAARQAEVADVLETQVQDRVRQHQVFELLEELADADESLADRVDRARGDVLRDAAGADERVVHPQAGDQLEDLEDLLACRESHGHDRRRAQLVAARGQADQVRRDAVELHEQDADDRGPLGHVVRDAQQLLDGQAVRGLLEQRRHVVHARAERHALGPGAELHVLLDAGVQVADARTGLGHRLAVDLEHEPEHAVRRRVLRTHVDDDPLLAEAGGLLGDVGPVAAGRLEARDALGVAVHDSGRGPWCLSGHRYDLRWSG